MEYKPHHFSFEDYHVAYLEGGSGMPLLLIHGSGPGASTLGNWRTILAPLAGEFHVFAMDLIGFGNSSRKSAFPYFDVDLWQRQIAAMLSRMPGGKIGVLAHSISGALALRLASTSPRVAAVLTTASMGAEFKVNAHTASCWTFPENVEELRRVAGILVHDKSLVDDAYIEARTKVLYADPSYAAYFDLMFDGDKQAFADAAILHPGELRRITCPVTMLHGRDDVAFPPVITQRIAEHIPQADVCLLSRCSHSIALERPERLLAEARAIFRQ